VELAKTIHAFEAGLEFGPLMSTVGRSEWIYGLIGGVHVSKKTEFMAELNGSARTNFTRNAVTLNFGIRHQLTEHSIWIASLGHEVRTPAGESKALVGYCCVQLLY
jgi:hypothetical protein